MVGQRLLQSGHCRLGAEMPKKTENQVGSDTPLLFCILKSAVDASMNRLKGDTSLSMGLGVEENFSMADILGGAAFQVGPGKVVEILLSLQHSRPRIVEIQRRLQVLELIGGSHRIYRGIGKGNIVTLSQREHQFRLKRSLNVNMQFSFGNIADERIH